MSIRQRLKHEIRALVLAGGYFAVWIGVLLLIKHLLLAEYHIAFHQWSLALVGALVLSKVVLVLEHVPLGQWVQEQPAWVDLILRTTLYSAGVAVVVILEKAFEGRHEHGGFVGSLKAGFEQADLDHILLNTICLSGALLGYNVLSVIRRHLGKGGLFRLFLRPVPKEAGQTPAESPTPKS